MIEFSEIIKNNGRDEFIIKLEDYIEYIVERLESDTDLRNMLILIRENIANYSKKLINYDEHEISFSDRKVTAGLEMLYTLGLINVKGKTGRRIILYEATELGELCLKKYHERVEERKEENKKKTNFLEVDN